MSARPTPLLTAFGWRKDAGPAAAPRRVAITGPRMLALLTLLTCGIAIANLMYLSDVKPIFTIKTVEFTEPDVAVILIMLAVVPWVLFNRFHGIQKLIAVPLALFFLASGLSASVANDKLRAFAAIIQMCEFVALMWGASLITSARSFLRIIHFIIGVFAFEALLATWQFIVGEARFPHGTFLTNQKYSQFMGFGAAMCYALFCSTTRRTARVGYFTFMLLLLFGALIGQERAPWLAFFISGTLISFLAAEGKRRKKLVVQFLATVLAIVITVASIPAVRDKVVSRIAEAQLADVGRNTLLSRLAVWGVAWQLFLTHPVLGVGPKNFTDIVPSYLSFEEMGNMETADPHNVWIGILAEGGVVGFLTYVPLCICILLLAYSKLRDPTWQPVRPLLLAYLAYHFFSFAMSYHYFVKAEGHFHFLMIGLMLGLHRGIREGTPLLPAANGRP